ncbi:hypothetical protein JMM63_07455 [Rhodovulum sulfidophilum]|nr:hypothetical protein [Rhodovulum sulfidophilum]MBL3554067.1 hypothetical protein [Rhodovulum sulfidophilum]MBL3595407.1 hypothetical protein [Rhodovulum sulfidophilum]MCE8442065.1 hypothetical protein [Rhodovulum sulfidophilum]MCE8470903.1 hypothetical protein [Rhodovulum sulfidophilum]NDK36229.1 hypothetical protein [Rhodovulum sulfidophilum]
MMKKLALPLLAATVLATAAHADEREAAAISAFESYCLASGGDLGKAIEALDASDSFEDGRKSGSGSFVYASYLGPDGINASVVIGGSMSDDKCSIILQNVADPMALADEMSLDMAKAAGAEPMKWEGFGDYGKGAYGYQRDDGDVLVAPMTTGISNDIVHINFYPT